MIVSTPDLCPLSYFQDQLSLDAGKKYCRMLQGEHSAILSTFIKLPFVIKIFVLSIFEWPLYTGFTVCINCNLPRTCMGGLDIIIIGCGTGGGAGGADIIGLFGGCRFCLGGAGLGGGGGGGSTGGNRGLGGGMGTGGLPLGTEGPIFSFSESGLKKNVQCNPFIAYLIITWIWI